MKIGQAIHSTLQQLSAEKEWKKYAFCSAEFYIEALLQMPLSLLVVQILSRALEKVGESCKHLAIEQYNEGYVVILSKKKDNHLPANFFANLERAIESAVSDFADNWQLSSLSLAEFYLPRKYAEKFVDNTVIYEHVYLKGTHLLLGRLATELSISDKLEVVYPNFGKLPEKTYIIGNKWAIMELISAIPNGLSPKAWQLMEEKQQPDKQRPVPSLTQICANLLAQQSLFSPNYSLTILQDKKLPDHLLDDIMEASMEPISLVSDMEKYAGKIVLFKANDPLDINKLYLVNPGNARVGLIGESTVGGGRLYKRGYPLALLLKTGMEHTNHVIMESDLKFCNLKFRLPLADELDKIQQAILEKHAEFVYYRSPIMLEKIAEQMKEFSIPALSCKRKMV